MYNHVYLYDDVRVTMHGGFFTDLFCMPASEAGHDLSQHFCSSLCNQGSTLLSLQSTMDHHGIEVQEVSANPWFKKEAMAVKT